MSSNNNLEQPNKMGVMPVGKLLVTMSIPLIISQLVQALYNIVDSMFVSRINEDALTAVSMCFPMQNLIIAVAVGTGVGVSALIARALGAQLFDKADRIARHGIFLAFCCYALFLFTAVFLARPYMEFQTEDEQIIKYGVTYLHIVCGFSVTVFVQINFEKFLQATGNTIYILFVQGVGAVVNVIMDPILIFGLFGFPELGVRGAAIATITGQGTGAVLGLIINRKRNKELHFGMSGFRPEWKDIREIYAIGLPSIIMQAITSVAVLLMNLILVTFSTTAVAVYGIYYKLSSFFFMPTFGLNNALIPIASYNYGAGNKSRLLAIMRLSEKYAVTILFIGTAIFWIIPGQLLSIFDASDSMMEIGKTALRITALGWPFAGYEIAKAGLFQALGKSLYSMYNAIVRNLIILLPAAYLLAQTGKIGYIWWASPIAEGMGLTTVIYFSYKIRHEIIDKMVYNDDN